jgi:hypothetical protein
LPVAEESAVHLLPRGFHWPLPRGNPAVSLAVLVVE